MSRQLFEHNLEGHLVQMATNEKSEGTIAPDQEAPTGPLPMFKFERDDRTGQIVLLKLKEEQQKYYPCSSRNLKGLQNRKVLLEDGALENLSDVFEEIYEIGRHAGFREGVEDMKDRATSHLSLTLLGF